MNSWDEVPIIESDEGFIQLHLTSWFLSIAWAAGPERTGRRPGTYEESLRPGVKLLPSDERDLSRVLNESLGSAGVPPLPPGYLWYLQLPEGALTQDDVMIRLDALIQEQMAATADMAVDEVTRAELRIFQEEVGRLY